MKVFPCFTVFSVSLECPRCGRASLVRESSSSYINLPPKLGEVLNRCSVSIAPLWVFNVLAKKIMRISRRGDQYEIALLNS